MIEPADNAALQDVLTHYGIRVQAVARLSGGLINDTWCVASADGERFAVQRLHAAISTDLGGRINRLGECLARHQLVSPLVLPTTDGEFFVVAGRRSWRVMTFIDGTSHNAAATSKIAAEAGTMLGRFHTALRDRDCLGPLPRSSVHDLSRHLANLRGALADHAGHAEFARVAALARKIFIRADTLTAIAPATPRIVHGDPKLSNFLFDANGSAICLVDLDTVGLMPLAWELGDAFRSWCNPHGEDTIATEFSLELFDAAVSAYASTTGGYVDPGAINAIVPAIETVYTELAARFCADALNESYFGWNTERFSSRTEHNLVRAEGQLHAATHLTSQRLQAVRIVAQAFAGVS